MSGNVRYVSHIEGKVSPFAFCMFGWHLSCFSGFVPLSEINGTILTMQLIVGNLQLDIKMLKLSVSYKK